MVASRYLFARTLSPKGRFDGHTTRLAIERVLNTPFSPDADLVPQLEDWMMRTVRQWIGDPGGSKWKFVALPSIGPALDLSGPELDSIEGSLPSNLRIEDILEAAPSSDRIPEARLANRGIITDWAERDSLNRKLGSFGERLVAELERRELSDAGRNDLAERVEIVAQTQGDGLGFDVLSFTLDGVEKYIEVKATRGAKEAPFMVSENERLRSEILGDSLWLYRLFKVSRQWRLFRLQGPFSKTLQLRSTQYKAVVSKDLGE